MIVFGTRGKAVAGPRRQGIVCSACGKDEHATYGILRYFHVFWIPMFPTLKQPAMECLHCKKALVGKEVPERVRKDIARLVFTRGRVVPMFSGLIVAALLVVPMAYAGMQESEKEAGFLRNPAVGDSYVVKLAGIVKGADSRHPYGVLQASGVAAGRLELRVGNYGYGSASGARKAIRAGEIARPDYFGAATIALSVEDLQRLKANGTIQSVKRP